MLVQENKFIFKNTLLSLNSDANDSSCLLSVNLFVISTSYDNRAYKH